MSWFEIAFENLQTIVVLAGELAQTNRVWFEGGVVALILIALGLKLTFAESEAGAIRTLSMFSIDSRDIVRWFAKWLLWRPVNVPVL